MSQTNPLNKYFRQPKIFISLPSKGLNYPPGVLAGDYTNVPIFAMTGMDEILFKTPDALFNGEASTKVIESCCPYIKDAKLMPNIDVDALLVAIRIATFGEQMSVNHTCNECGEQGDFDIDLRKLIDYFSSIKFDHTIDVSEELTVRLRPLNYKEMTEFSIENFKLQRMLYQISDVEEAKQQEHLNAVYQKLAEIQIELFMLSIESVQTPDAVVTDKEMIREWLRNADSTVYKKIKDVLESNKNSWSIPKQTIKCAGCGHEDQISITLDQSNFFG
jgi:hypothetical protein